MDDSDFQNNKVQPFKGQKQEGFCLKLTILLNFYFMQNIRLILEDYQLKIELRPSFFDG